MKRSTFIALAVTVGVATAGCSATIPGTPTAATSLSAGRQATHSSQVVLPFDNHNVIMLAGIAVDAADNLYVLDFYGQAWQMAPGADKPKLVFTDLGRPVDAATDAAGNLYVTDVSQNRVLKLAPRFSDPTVLPFTSLTRPTAVAVDTRGNVYVTDQNANRVLKLDAGASSPTALPFNGLYGPCGVAVDSKGNVYLSDLSVRILKLPAL